MTYLCPGAKFHQNYTGNPPVKDLHRKELRVFPSPLWCGPKVAAWAALQPPVPMPPLGPQPVFCTLTFLFLTPPLPRSINNPQSAPRSLYRTPESSPVAHRSSPSHLDAPGEVWLCFNACQYRKLGQNKGWCRNPQNPWVVGAGRPPILVGET